MGNPQAHRIPLIVGSCSASWRHMAEFSGQETSERARLSLEGEGFPQVWYILRVDDTGTGVGGEPCLDIRNCRKPTGLP